MRFLVPALVVLFAVCQIAFAQDAILGTMCEQAEIVCHVKILELQGGRIEEAGVEEWAALCQVVEPIKGTVKKDQNIRFRFNRMNLKDNREPLVAEKDKQYVIFLSGTLGGVRFPADEQIGVAYTVLDRWVGVMPHNPLLVDRLKLLARRPTVRPEKEQGESATIAGGRQLAQHTNIAGSVFRDVNLSEATFDDVNLGASTFENVNMTKTRMHDINLNDLDVSAANLGGAHFKYIGPAPDKDGKQARQKAVTFEEAMLCDSTFTKVDLSNARITNCDLTGMTIDGVLVTDMIAAYKAQRK